MTPQGFVAVHNRGAHCDRGLGTLLLHVDGALKQRVGDHGGLVWQMRPHR